MLRPIKLTLIAVALTADLSLATPAVEVDFVAHARPPRERDGLDGLGDFRAVRQLILRTVPR